MAQTKTATKKPKSKSSRPRRKASTRSGSSTRSSSGSRQSASNGSSNSVAEGVKAARETVEDAGQKAGQAASKAKVPLIAGGAALAGAAGGMALNAARSKGRKGLGVRMPKTKIKVNTKDLAKAADRVAGAGEQIGRLSTGIRQLQGTADASNGNGQHRSPIEVLIQGLTRRH